MPEVLAEITPEQAEADLRAALAPQAASPAPGQAESAPPAGAAAATEGETPNDSTADTRAAAETQPPTEPKTETQGQTKPDGKPDNRTEYAKNQERLDKTWKSVNARKAELEAKEAEIARREQELTAKAAKAQARYSPEDYEQASVRNQSQAEQLALQAKGLDAQAREFEEDGKYTEAESAKARANDLREQAAYARGVAKQLKEQAEHVRKNPDPTVEQLKAKTQAQLREYTLAAAKEWPDIVKDGSEFQKAVAKNIADARSKGLDENEFPVIRYYSARLAAMESAAARVPGLEKQLGAAAARVKELEALTAPGGGQGSIQNAQLPETDFAKLTVEQMEADLRSRMR